MPHPNPRILIPIVLISGLAIGGWYVEKQRSERRSALSGFFESQPAELASRVGGRVARILVHEGDSVRKGQELVILEANSAAAETDARRAVARQAEARVQELESGSRREEIRRQEAAVAEARAALDRVVNGPRAEEIAAARERVRQVEALHRKATAGPRPQEIEQARAAEREARARLAQAQRGPTPEERNQARARVAQVVAELDLAQKDLRRYQTLFDEGAVSRQRLDQANAAVEALIARRSEAEQALRRLELGTPREELDQARAAQRRAEAALKLLLAGSRKEDIEAAAAETRAARQNLKMLLNGSRPEDVRAARARVDQAQAALALLRAGTRAEQIAQAKAAAEGAQAQLRASSETIEERAIRAPQDGVVERLLVAAGDLVAAGMPVARMADPSDIWIRTYIPESILAHVPVGGTAELQVDGIRGTVPAIVESIATRGEFTPANLQTPSERGKQVFAVRLRLKSPDPRIKAGMYATVRR